LDRKNKYLPTILKNGIDNFKSKVLYLMSSNKMEIKQVPYFAFEVDAWDSERERILLHFDNIETLLEKLENGENLFEIVPEIKGEEFDKFSMKYSLFERREEFILDGKTFVSTEDYKQVGKLLVPNYGIVTREELESRTMNFNNSFFDKKICAEVLERFPEVDEFYNGELSKYTPLKTKKVLILNEDQLFFNPLKNYTQLED